MTRIAAALLAAGIMAAVLTVAAHADAPRFKIERGEACVAPVAEMRRDHMKTRSAFPSRPRPQATD